MKKIKTWKDNINDVIRYVLFPDEELKELMLIPDKDKSNIMKFITNYFIRSVAPDEILTDEDVRICYSEDSGRSLGSNCLKKFFNCDVYVKTKNLHDCGNDLLAFRTDKICQKLKELLTTEKYVCMIDFTYEDDYDLFSKLAGYTRHRIVFSYKITF